MAKTPQTQTAGKQFVHVTQLDHMLTYENGQFGTFLAFLERAVSCKKKKILKKTEKKKRKKTQSLEQTANTAFVENTVYVAKRLPT